MTRPDPTDKELLEFVARFAGWHEEEHPEIGAMLIGPNGEVEEPPPDYLNSVDAWLRDVWPKIDDMKLGPRWFHHLRRMNEDFVHRDIQIANADARSRCLALYRTLEGRLP